MRCSQLKAAKLLQFGEGGDDEAAEALAKGGAEDGDEEGESGQSLEASNEQDGIVPGQLHVGDEQGWAEINFIL